MTITVDEAAAMAYLSWAANDYSYDYIPDPFFGTPPVHVTVTAKQNLDDSGWRALQLSGLTFNPDGFFFDGPAAALVAVKDDTLVVAV